MLRRLAKFLRKKKARKNDDVTIHDLQDTIAMILFLKRVFDKVDVRHIVIILSDVSVEGINTEKK